MIPHDFIETLLGRIDIVAVIDRLVPLRKAGTNFVACCPFHAEKSPSFTVSPSKQFYHCFGCGAHGTAIGFLMEHGGRSFPEAVDELARDAGLEVPREQRPGEAERREASRTLAEFLRDAARFYRASLKASPRAIEYLKGRGLTGAIAARFGIGYAPEGWQPLAAAFPGYDDDALETAGLVIVGEGKRYDRFRDRVMFPIHDNRGQVIGFGGRVLDRGEPKYLNSPETPLFSKGRELYGLYQARPAIRDAGRVIVVEGYMDVVALAQHGVDYAVATLGTATTPAHVQKLFRLTDTVVFCFDGDQAGRKAAWRALENALPVLVDGKEAAFLFLPDGMDPDDFIRQRGKAAFEALVARATPLSEFMLAEFGREHPPTSVEGRAGFVAAARTLVRQVSAPILATVLKRRVAELAGLHEAELGELLAAGKTPGTAGGPADRAAVPNRPARGRAASPTSSRPAPSLVKRLLQRLLVNPGLARTTPIPHIEGTMPEASALNAVVGYCQAAAGPLSSAGVMQAFTGTAHEGTLAAALTSAETQVLEDDAALEDLRAGIARYCQQAQLAGRVVSLAAPPAMNAEEVERLRQVEMVRQVGNRPEGRRS
ncbi:MAG: DNA primase [Casimicrobiaceae bacterium]